MIKNCLIASVLAVCCACFVQAEDIPSAQAAINATTSDKNTLTTSTSVATDNALSLEERYNMMVADTTVPNQTKIDVNFYLQQAVNKPNDALSNLEQGNSNLTTANNHFTNSRWDDCVTECGFANNKYGSGALHMVTVNGYHSDANLAMCNVGY